MSKEYFRKLLSQWANEDVYIGQLTWEEGDALAERLTNWHASQQSVQADGGYCDCKFAVDVSDTTGEICQFCNRPRR